MLHGRRQQHFHSSATHIKRRYRALLLLVLLVAVVVLVLLVAVVVLVLLVAVVVMVLVLLVAVVVLVGQDGRQCRLRLRCFTVASERCQTTTTTAVTGGHTHIHTYTRLTALCPGLPG